MNPDCAATTDGLMSLLVGLIRSQSGVALQLALWVVVVVKLLVVVWLYNCYNKI